MTQFAISRSFYTPRHDRAPLSLARPGRNEGSTGSAMKKKAVSALTVIGTAAGVSYAEAKWGLPAIKFSKDEKSFLNHFGTSDFLGGAAILGLSLWGKIPAKYDSIATDVAKGSLAHWASVTVYNSTAPGKERKPSHPVNHIWGNNVAGQVNGGARRAMSAEQVWQGQFANR